MTDGKFPFLQGILEKPDPAELIPKKPEKCVIHTFKRVKKPIRGQVFYRCVAKHCMAPPIARDLLFDKEALCFYCHTPFILTPRGLEKATPHCGCQKKVRVGKFKPKAEVIMGDGI